MAKPRVWGAGGDGLKQWGPWKGRCGVSFLQVFSGHLSAVACNLLLSVMIPTKSVTTWLIHPTHDWKTQVYMNSALCKSTQSSKPARNH
jgi:hypothetical protein